jgi:hypothetical protein
MPLPDPDPHRVAQLLRAVLPELEALAQVEPRASEPLADLRGIVAKLEVLAEKRQKQA